MCKVGCMSENKTEKILNLTLAERKAVSRKGRLRQSCEIHVGVLTVYPSTFTEHFIKAGRVIVGGHLRNFLSNR